jgi:hypothetical protein
MSKIMNSDRSRLVKEKFTEGSKGTENPLRTCAMASSGNSIPSLTAEGHMDELFVL